jgi:hypothetical protein
MIAKKVNEFRTSGEIVKMGKDFLIKKSIEKCLNNYDFKYNYNYDESTNTVYVDLYKHLIRITTKEFLIIKNLKQVNVVFNGSILLNNITTFPDSFSITGFLNINSSPIYKLPNNLHIGDSFYLYHSNITNLPDNLYIGGDLDLESTNVNSLPNNLYIGGNLNISRKNINNLPKDLTVKGTLYIIDTKLNGIKLNKEELNLSNVNKINDNLNWKTLDGIDLNKLEIIECQRDSEVDYYLIEAEYDGFPLSYDEIETFNEYNSDLVYELIYDY